MNRQTAYDAVHLLFMVEDETQLGMEIEQVADAAIDAFLADNELYERRTDLPFAMVQYVRADGSDDAGCLCDADTLAAEGKHHQEMTHGAGGSDES